ncbi:MAG: isoleucine--tRNA ligase, partial [Patescibacteria group bacterium]
MAKHKLKPIETNYVPNQVEEEVLAYWKKNEIFEKSVQMRPEKDSYSFYDGPPFITGLPHYGHLLGSIVKDVIPRYQTMKGKRVRRVWGWDCHGLPAENKVEKQLGINSKKEIETLGIDKFIAACKDYVGNVSAEWEWYVDHIGRWVDFKNAYKTMDTDYMESVIWVFHKLYDKKLIYKGKRVSLFCPRCSTPISNFEVAMDNSYKDVTDPSVFAKFKVKGEDKYLLAWTTTPWTLPTNFALGVAPDEDYVEVESAGERYILAQSRVKAVFADKKYEEKDGFKGQKLVGLSYEPLYAYYAAKPQDHQVYAADFVSLEDGTGIVHIAPGFGEDDTALGKEHDLTMAESVDEEGKLDPKVTVAAGKFFKSADKLILADLQSHNLVFKLESIIHSYPHCHRCETPLIYKVQKAWYLDVASLKKQMKATNQDINWVPGHFKHGRFELGIDSAPDWCISRTRYWGAPIPVWECSCGEIFVPSSIKDLEDWSGQKITDLHRPDIDKVTIKCIKCDGVAHRVPEVLDSWVEAASMPYGQRHYPFENEKEFLANFPADFITEYTGQLRAWFYVMHVISNALFKTNCFKNVIVQGVIMGNDGRKMSKNYGNYPDPKDYIVKYGADSLRLYLMGSPIMVGQDIIISETDWQEHLKTTLMTLWNSYKFFINYAALDNWEPKIEMAQVPTKLDLWILSRLNETVLEIDKQLAGYQIPKAVATIRPFVSDLSTWYIRRSRDRVGPTAVDKTDRDLAYTTLRTVFAVFSQAVSPIIPFISEYI